jgi:hypothetical protein
VYGEDREAGLRDYLLKEVQPERGLYLLDEQNSIEMEAYYLGGKLYQQFAVMGSLLVSTTERVGDTLIWEIIAGPREPLRSTGGASEDDPEFPEVDVFQVQTCQRALLKKK